MKKDSRYYKLIQSARWRDLRGQKLNRNPLCEVCQQNGIYTAATEVHHVIPAESAISDNELEGLMFNIHNLQSLCHACHVNEHRNMHSHSAEAQKRRQSERTERFINNFFGREDGKMGGAFFIDTPSAPNPLPKSREKFLVPENSLGGETPDRQNI